MKVIIVDDHIFVRDAIINYLKDKLENVTFFSFNNVEKTELFLEKNSDIDLIITDIEMPEKTGIDLLISINNNYSNIKTILLSMYSDFEIVKYAFYLGAFGYILKENYYDELLTCINEVGKGNKFISKAINEENYNEKRKIISKEIKPLLMSLTNSERKVIKLISQKYTTKEISEILSITTNSVENYRNRICRKLDLDNKHNSLLIWALQYKLII